MCDLGLEEDSESEPIIQASCLPDQSKGCGAPIEPDERNSGNAAWMRQRIDQNTA